MTRLAALLAIAVLAAACGDSDDKAAPTTAAARDAFGTSSAAGVFEASKPPDGRATG